MSTDGYRRSIELEGLVGEHLLDELSMGIAHRGRTGVRPLALPGWRIAQYEAAVERHHDLIGASA